MDENFYSYSQNQISDNDYIETERKHLKHKMNKQISEF